MSSITSLLQRLKVESKKNVTSVSKNADIEYQLENIELDGQTFSMKKVAILGDRRYQVGWILDNQTPSCMRCTKGFNLLKWKHHCRSCGYVICQACGDKKLNFDVFAEEAPGGSRVCSSCYDSCTNIRKNGNGKKGPRTLVSSTPVPAQIPVAKESETVALPTVVESSLDMNATLDTEATTIESSETSEITTHSANVAVDNADKFYVPKMRPSMATAHRPASFSAPPLEDLNSGASSKPVVCRSSGTGLGLDLPPPANLAAHHVAQSNPTTTTQPVMLDLSSAQAAPSLSMPQPDQCAPAPPARKSKELPSTSVPTPASAQSTTGMLTGSLQPISRTYDYSARDDDQSLSAHSMAALNSSTVSTATKTTINTQLNSKLTAPPPRLGVTCTAPEIFSPVHKNTFQDPNTLDLSTPPSGGSCGSGEAPTDFAKFGSPVTRKLIMEDARCNVIWEADDDDASSTTCSSVAPTPSSGISGTTNGGAGVGYIRSPWDNTFSPFNSAQKPRRLMGSGNTSAGKSGRRRKFSSDQPSVRFAAEDAAFSANAAADIADAIESSPGLPLTREQLLFQQQYLRHQQMHLQSQQAGKVPTKVELQSKRDAENAHVNVMPAENKEVGVVKAEKKDVVQRTVAANSGNNTEADKASAVAVGLPALGKSGVNKGIRAAPR